MSKNSSYTAVVVGATGLTGSFLVDYLIEDENCQEIRIIVRRKSPFVHPKIKEQIIDFSKQEDYEKYIKGDVLFSCLGTTRKQAGSPENQYKVDYTYQYNAAAAAAKNGIKNYLLVSSPWANIASKNYYRKMKAELEQDTANLDFDKIAFLKPNGLMGQRTQPRMGEKYAIKIFLSLTNRIPSLRKHKPIAAKKVARAMLNVYYLFQKEPRRIFTFSRRAVEDVAL